MDRYFVGCDTLKPSWYVMAVRINEQGEEYDHTCLKEFNRRDEAENFLLAVHVFGEAKALAS